MGGGLICLPLRQLLLLDYIVTPDLFLLSGHCNCLLVIKHRYFNDLGRVSCNSKTASVPVNYMSWFPSELRGKAVPLTESPYSS